VAWERDLTGGGSRGGLSSSGAQLIHCVAISESLPFPGPQFPHLSNKEVDSIGDYKLAGHKRTLTCRTVWVLFIFFYLGADQTGKFHIKVQISDILKQNKKTPNNSGGNFTVLTITRSQE
jgi:hypothetical protein